MGPVDSTGAVQQHPGDGNAVGSIDFATRASEEDGSGNSPDHHLQVWRTFTWAGACVTVFQASKSVQCNCVDYGVTILKRRCNTEYETERMQGISASGRLRRT